MTPAIGGEIGGGRDSGARRRLFALAALLVLSLTLGAALAFQAIQTSRRYRETAERALTDYSGFAAFILASRAYRQLGGDAIAAFAAWPGAVPRGTACPAGNIFFERPPKKETFRILGPPLAAADRQFLADTMRNAMPLLAEVMWRFRYIASPSPGPDGYFVTSYRTRGGEYGLHGFSVCLGGDSSIFRRAMLSEAALPPAVTGVLPPDSMFSVAVATGAGRTIYTSPHVDHSPYRGSARLGAEFGDLTLQLDLRESLAGRLVIGGIPSSPTPLAAGLLGLSTLLVITALLQLRREYELIGIRSDFIANASHEIRTPLSQILLFTELLKLGRLRTAEERERAIDIIDQETRRLIRLADNVLQFGRSGTKRQPLECAPLDLVAALQETVDAFRPLATARGVALRLDVAAATIAQADRSALRQIVLNLLDNAVKYGPRGQSVSIRAQTADGHTTIAVEDQGPGIPVADRERVWQGYYRLPREVQSAIAGSGIGLAVVRSLATQMHGRSWVEEAPGGGARFVVELTSGNGGTP